MPAWRSRACPFSVSFIGKEWLNPNLSRRAPDHGLEVRLRLRPETAVLDFKLAACLLIAAGRLGDPSFDGQMQRMRSLSGITTRFGPASGAHHGDTNRHQSIPEIRGFPRAQRRFPPEER